MSRKIHAFILRGTGLRKFCKMLTNYLSDELNQRSFIFFIYHQTDFDSWKYLLTIPCPNFITKKEAE